SSGQRPRLSTLGSNGAGIVDTTDIGQKPPTEGGCFNSALVPSSSIGVLVLLVSIQMISADLKTNEHELSTFSNYTRREGVVRVLAIIEGDRVSGPAKNVFEFCRIGRTIDSQVSLEVSIATFQRSKNGSAGDCEVGNDLVDAARQNGIPIFVV